MKEPSATHRLRLFYFGAAAVLLVLTFLGFQQFYLHGRAYPDRELAPPIQTLIILHGLSMTAWVLLFLVQPLLIVVGNRRVHRMLGGVGAVLAAGIVITGFRLGIESTRIKPPDMKLWNLDPTQFMAVPNVGILVFAGFVIAGVWNRRRPEVHRPMMLMATLAALPAATDRIDFMTALYRDTLWGSLFGPFFGGVATGLILLVIKSLLTRSLDRWFAASLLALAVSCALIMQIATTGAWDRFASFLLR